MYDCKNIGILVLVIIICVIISAIICVIIWNRKETYKNSGLRKFIKKYMIPNRLENITFKRYGLTKEQHQAMTKKNKETLLRGEWAPLPDDGDGEYILSPDLLKYTDVIYTYGIHDQDLITCNLAKELDVMVYQYDCFCEHNPTCPNTSKQKFIKECIGRKRELKHGVYMYNTLENHIKQNNDEGKNILMFMDIEGSEYDVLINLSDRILKQIVQLQLEIHWFFDDDRGAVDDIDKNYMTSSDRFIDQTPNSKLFKKLIKKMLKTHYIAHVHCNNYTCIGIADGPKTSQENVPCDVIEVLFINKKYTSPTSEKLQLPLSIDKPNRSDSPDCHWSF